MFRYLKNKILVSILVFILIVSYSSFSGAAPIREQANSFTRQIAQSLNYIPRKIYVYAYENDVRAGNRSALLRNLARVNQGTEAGVGEKIWIQQGETNGANLGFVSNRPEISPIVSAGYSGDTSSSYYFAPNLCRTEGSFVIGWSTPSVRLGDRGTCSEVSHRHGERIGPSANNPKQTEPTAWSFLSKEDIQLASLLNPQVVIDSSIPVHLRYYCSAMSSNGAWGVALSDRPLSIEIGDVEAQVVSTKARTCENAKAVCLERGGSNCLVLSEDVWRFTSAYPELQEVDLYLNCANIEIPYYEHSGIGYENVREGLSNLEASALADDAQSCVFSIRYYYEVFIRPSLEERTLISTGVSEDGVVIDDLVGSITIKPSGDPVTTEAVTLNAGDRYVITPSTLGEEGRVQKVIPLEDREAVTKRRSVQAFFDKTKWPEEFASEIDAYWDGVKTQFLPPSPPATVTLKTVAGIEVWDATIDLTNPDLVFSLVRDCNVRNEAGLRSLATNRKTALIMGGIYSRGSNCDPLNFALISEQQLKAGSRGTGGTVLGIGKDNQNLKAEILTTGIGESPDWDNYIFAVTAGPRILVAGQPRFSPAQEGHSESFIREAQQDRRRAAFCLSQNRQILHYVVTQRSNATLPELSTVLRAADIGCWDGFNLDGGGAPALALGQEVIVPPGREQPYLMVMYTAGNAPSDIRRVWQN
jgi:hypothetical protein